MEIFKHFHNLDRCLSPEFSSQEPDYREKIRQNLFERFGDESLRNLDAPPTLGSDFVSIAHTQGLGGWIKSARPVGMDLEFSGRVITQRVAQRIACHPDEPNHAPSYLAFWVSKEASFKALWRCHQPPVLSHIEVSNWTPLGGTLFRYKFNNINNLGAGGFGLLQIGERFTLGISQTAP